MIEEVEFNDVLPFKNIIKKERVTLENPANAHWYAIKNEGNIVAFYCLVLNKTARFKSNYTVKEFRHRGYLGMFIDHAISECKEHGIKVMTAFCTPLSVGQHERKGGIIVSRKGDISFVKYELV